MTYSQTAHAAASDDARPFLKPGWSPFNILLMVLGFIVFWPLGLAMLAYNIWGHKFGDLKTDLKRQFDMSNDWSSCKRQTKARPTGNAAFDAYRERELNRLEEERAKIDAMRQEFDDYMETLRQARDQEEFDRFMSNRKPSGKSNGNDTVIDT